jgi:glutamate N-acetyltransferase/amino-acid N-acetyltransferase
MTKISPLAPASFPIMPAIEGVKFAVAEAGIKYKNRTDVMLAELSEGTVVAGAFTKSRTASANIVWGKKILPVGKGRLLIVNSGNANAFNGRAGEESVARIVKIASEKWDCGEDEIYPCSTGVIGQPLPDNKIIDALDSLKQNLKSDLWFDAAKAIMTTDTFPKGVTKTAVIDGVQVTINGIAKGSGMIAPDMATMLSYIFTDAAIDAAVLQKIFISGVEKSFNSITVDSDTSTSDTALIFATGKAGNAKITDVSDPLLKDFSAKLDELLLELAHLVVKDGEGATKFIRVDVTGAASDKAAKVIAMSIANSPLVKTAIAGEDANWGRIVMAVGKSGEEADRDKMSVSVGGIVIVKDGQLNPDYVEAEVTKHMKGQNIELATDVGIGRGKATVWTCDLTHEYITINADYRS